MKHTLLHVCKKEAVTSRISIASELSELPVKGRNLASFAHHRTEGEKVDSQSLLIRIEQRNLTTFVKLCKCTRAWKGQRDEMIARQIVIQMWQLFHPEL